MYQLLTFYHSLTRWLVVLSLGYALYRAGRGLLRKSGFGRWDNAVRHWTATIAHIQLLLGFALYYRSPVASYFLRQPRQALGAPDSRFFGLIHPLVMILAIVAVTVGSASAKRRTEGPEKFRTVLLWYGAALVLILAAIPWPFSPLANRPYFR